MIIAAVIILLVFCWIFGRGCSSNNEAKENEKLRAYTSSVNKVIQRSAAVGTAFDNLRNGVGDLSRDDISRKLSQMVNDCKDISREAGKLIVPAGTVKLQDLLELGLDYSKTGVDKFRTALLDVLDKKNVDAAPDTMSQGLMDLVIGDEIMQRFRSGLESKLKTAKLSFEKVANSVFVPNKDSALTAGVHEYLSAFSGTETGNEVHGVAVSGLTTSPAKIDTTESDVSILPYQATFTVKITVKNQGNQEEEGISVVATLTQEPEGTTQKKTQKITRLKADESQTVVFEGLKPATGDEKENVLKVEAGPVSREKNVENNTIELRFVMRAQEK